MSKYQDAKWQRKLPLDQRPIKYFSRDDALLEIQRLVSLEKVRRLTAAEMDRKSRLIDRLHHA